MKMASMVVDGDAAKMKLAEEVAGVCGEISDGDRCELAAKVGDCLRSEGLKRKMAMGDGL